MWSAPVINRLCSSRFVYVAVPYCCARLLHDRRLRPYTAVRFADPMKTRGKNAIECSQYMTPFASLPCGPELDNRFQNAGYRMEAKSNTFNVFPPRMSLFLELSPDNDQKFRPLCILSGPADRDLADVNISISGRGTQGYTDAGMTTRE
jgi:hypothetical protein